MCGSRHRIIQTSYVQLVFSMPVQEVSWICANQNFFITSYQRCWTPLDDVANNSATSSFLCSTGDKSALLTSRRARRLVAVSEPLRGSQSGCLVRVWLRECSAERRSVSVCRSRLPVVKPWFKHLFPSLFIDNESYNNDRLLGLCGIMKSQKRRTKTS